jgi:hypothetical protein
MGDDGAAALARAEAELAKRWPESRIDPTLDRMKALVELLDQPQTRYPVIHVTGTNGKTSTARLIESLLIAFGLRTGRFTSPHVESVTERIVLDGQPLSPERFAAAFEEVAPYLDVVDAQSDVPLSFFECFAMAYTAFADAPVDAVYRGRPGGEGTRRTSRMVKLPSSHRSPSPAALPGNDAENDRADSGIIAGAVASLLNRRGRARGGAGSAGRRGRRHCRQEGLEFGVLQREVAVGARSGCAGSAVITARSICRYSAPTRRRMPLARSRPSRPSSVAATWTVTSYVKASPGRRRLDGSRSSVPRRPSCSTPPTTRQEPRRRPAPSAKASRSAAWSGSWR